MSSPLAHRPAPYAAHNPTAVPASQPRGHQPAFGRELDALPDELFDRRHLAFKCDARVFGKSRFAAVIAPWLNRFTPRLTQALKDCYDYEPFRYLARTAVGTQLRAAKTLLLEECETIGNKDGVMVRVSPGRYELLAPTTSSHTDESHVDNCAEGWGTVPRRARGCLAPDQKYFVRVCRQTALVHKQQPDGSWHEEARLHHDGEPVCVAEWSPGGQQLVTLSDKKLKVWCKSGDSLWEAVITRTLPDSPNGTLGTLFSPDERTFLLHSKATGVHAWWCREDGCWTTSDSWDLSGSHVNQIVFSPDSEKMAMLWVDHRRSLDRVFIWIRTAAGSWQQEGTLAMNAQRDALFALAGAQSLPGDAQGMGIQALAFNTHGQLAVGYTLESPDPSQQDTFIEVWNLASQRWNKQAQLMTVAGQCWTHAGCDEDMACGRLNNLVFSPDGLFLVAEDICGRVQGWCLVAPHPGSDSSNEPTGPMELAP